MALVGDFTTARSGLEAAVTAGNYVKTSPRGSVVADPAGASPFNEEAARSALAPDNLHGPMLALLAGLLYFIACRLGHWLILQPERISPIWPASGVALVLLARSQPRHWKWALLGVAAAQVPASLGLSRPFPLVACFAVANLAQALLGAIILTDFGRDRVDFSSMRHFIRLLLVIGPLAALTASIAALVAPLGYVPHFLHFWRLWFSSGGVGILVITPMVLGVSRDSLRWPGLARAAEAAVLTVAGVVVAWVIIWTDAASRFHLLRYPFLMPIPLLLWASLRLGVPWTTFIAFELSATAIVGIVRGHRPYIFRGLPDEEIFLGAQVLAIGWTACGLVLAVANSQNRRSENHLRKSEERFRRMAETIDDVFWMAGVGIKSMLYISPAYERVWGRSRESLITDPRSFLDAVHLEDRPRVESLFRMQAVGKPFENEYRVVRPDGSIRWVHDRGFPVTDAQGNVTHYAGVAQDITQRRSDQAALALFRALIDRTTDGIEVVDPETARFLDVNEKSCVDSGYTRDEYLSKSVYDLDPNLGPSLFKEIREAVERSGSHAIESVHRRRDGSTFPVEVNIRWVQLDRVYMVTVVRDITERKRSEELLRQSHQRFKTLADAAFEGILITDAGRIIDLNDQFASMFGYHREELIGRDVATMIRPEDRGLVLDNIQSGADSDVEHGVYRKDGSMILVQAHGRSAVLDGRQVRITALRDVTERRRAEKELRQRRNEIDRLDRINTLGQMAGGLAHELNQPLAAILNYSSGSVGMVRDAGATAEQVLPALEAISAEARRAGDIIAWLQSFIRKQEPTRRPLHVNERIRHTIELLNHNLNQARIVLSLELTEPLPAAVGGTVQVDQVLVNLIHNAIEAMQSPGAAGSAVTVRSCLDGGFIRVEVADLGCGMSADRVGSMFEPFFTTKADGIGMGLAISRAIIIDCGGELTASPGPHGGMTMSFTLPVDPAATRTGGMS
jgi:PAS domain S-box-containing protein